jgi:hypothetical protein
MDNKDTEREREREKNLALAVNSFGSIAMTAFRDQKISADIKVELQTL